MAKTLANIKQEIQDKFEKDVINSGMKVEEVQSFQIVRHGNATKVKMILVTGTRLLLPTEYTLTDELMELVDDINAQLNIAKLTAIFKPNPIF